MAFRSKPKTKATTPKNKTTITRRQIVNSICIVFLSTALITSTIAFVVLQNILNKETVIAGIDGLSSQNSTRIFDKDGVLITTLSGESGVRENIKYEQIPQVVIDAFLAVEDSRYFSHNGFDLPRFIKSGLVNVSAGGIKQGGSTLTMQLVDVALFSEEAKLTASTSEKLEQKVQEIFKAMEIEDELSKEKILENYLNKINFGGPARGLQKGAQYYFGKDAKDLDLSEAAFLAGVINAPATNNPYNGVSYDDETQEVTINHYDQAVYRRNTALDLMKLHGYITDEELALAKATNLSFELNGATQFKVDAYQNFITYVVKEAERKTGENPYTTAMDIYTTMDRSAQEYADAIDNEEALDYQGNVFDIAGGYDERFQMGFAAIDNQTGAILALGGGRGDDDNVNRAWNETHQVGSTSKPIVDYAPAFDELGYSTMHVLEDGPTAYGSDGGVLSNASGQFQGDVFLSEAINHSLNVPAYKTMLSLISKIGEDGVVNYLKKLGFPESVTNEFSVTYAIGGGNFSVTPLQLAGAYQTLANGGNYIEPYTISEINFQSDDIEDYKVESEKQQVYSAGAAWLTSYMLAGAVAEGYGSISALQAPYPIYGKTGTTDFDEKTANYYGYPVGIARDKWLVGYTTQYTVATWAGYDMPEAGLDNYLTDYKLNNWNLEGRITRSMLDELTKDGTEGVGTLAMPDDVTQISHIKGLFPYATATENQSDLMTTAYILKKYSGNLSVVTPDPLSTPTSFDAKYDQGKVSFTLAEYPDKEKLTEASHEKTMVANGVSIVGRRIFDKSFLFGAVRYKVDISVNGSEVTTQTLDGPTGSFSAWPNALKDGDEVKVCGYYGYDKTDTTSDKLCKTITISGVSKDVTIDDGFDALFTTGLTYAQAEAKAKTYMKQYYPDINFTVAKSNIASTETGTLGSDSDIYSGAKLNTAKSYVIRIGAD